MLFLNRVVYRVVMLATMVLLARGYLMINSIKPYTDTDQHGGHCQGVQECGQNSGNQ